MPIQPFGSVTVTVTESFGVFFSVAVVALWVLCVLAYVMAARWFARDAREDRKRHHDEAWARYESERLSWPKRIGIMALLVGLFLLSPASIYGSLPYLPYDFCPDAGWFVWLLYGCYW